MELAELGKRICILGPSNSGKSTLAYAISKKQKCNVIHMDQLHHLPNTNWQPRPIEEFINLHDVAILDKKWVIEGNYSRCLPQRLDRATGVILLRSPVLPSLYRYIRRTLFDTSRHGNLEGSKDSLKWSLMHYIAFEQPMKLHNYEVILKDRGIKYIKLKSMREVNKYYERWEISRL